MVEAEKSMPIAKTIGLREAGFNEYWLQEQIYNNPELIGLGELEAVAKEKRQSSGGKLDILLKNPEDDTMYEVEVMLGATDESHIIRTIEYWDNEKRKWPQRQHYAVLIAETITRRFFNVIQLLSHSIPIIAIQVNLVELNGHRALHFSKILDTYEEIDDGTNDNEIYDEIYWKKKAPWTIEAAKTLYEIVKDMFDEPTIRFVKHYISINIEGKSYFWFHKRSSKKSLINFRISDNDIEEVKQLLDNNNISYTQKRNRFNFTCDANTIKNNAELFKQLAEFERNFWEK